MVNKRHQGFFYEASFKLGSSLIENKKGWIRIVEAMVAILLISGFLILIIDNPENRGKDISAKVYVAENAILREVQLNNTYRTYILGIGEAVVEFDNFNVDLKNHIKSRTPLYLNCTGKLCDFATDPVCDIEYLEKNIYVRSVMIAANSDIYEPKLLKIFCWTA